MKILMVGDLKRERGWRTLGRKKKNTCGKEKARLIYKISSSG